MAGAVTGFCFAIEFSTGRGFPVNQLRQPSFNSNAAQLSNAPITGLALDPLKV